MSGEPSTLAPPPPEVSAMTDFYLALAGAGLLGVLEVYVFPYRKCRACDGGKKWSPLNTGRNWHHCPACHGSGKRVRWLAAVLGRK